MINEEDAVKAHQRRLDALGNIILLSFLVILIRLWYLQIYNGKMFLRYSVENRLRKEIVKAPRGMIFSRDNNLLVTNTPRFDLVIIPQYFKHKKEVFALLAKVLDMPVNSIKKKYSRGYRQERFRPVTIKKNLTQKEVAQIETERLLMPGVKVELFISRGYLDGEVGGHLLGYISEISKSQLPKYRKRDKFNYKLGDFIGQDGLEEYFDAVLRGRDGHEFKEVDALGRMKRHIKGDKIFKDISNSEIQPGSNIRLTIDRDLQLAAFEALEGKEGSAVAVDVNTGEILAMVSRPGYLPSNFSKGLTSKYWKSLRNDTKRPLRDRTIQEHYSPGSTFKLFTAMLALEEGMIDPDQQVSCPPTFRLGRRVYHDWKKYGFGQSDLYKSIQSSVDVYYYKIGARLDIDVLASYAKEFGFASKTGITLPHETTGLIPTKEWKLKKNGIPWQQGETISCVIGQSYILVTPLQLALAYAAIANEGTLYKPYVVKEIFNNDGSIVKRFEPQISNKITKVSKKTFQIVKEGLYRAVNWRKGTAYWHRGQGIEMAGKTGTSQVVSMSSAQLFEKCEEKEYRFRHHAIFAAFAPFYAPKIAISVVVEHGCHGSSAAAPVAKKIATTYMKKYYPQEYEENKKKQKERERIIYLANKKKEDAKKRKIEEEKEKKEGTVE